MVALCRLVLVVLSRMGASPAQDEIAIYLIISRQLQSDNALRCGLQEMVERAMLLSPESVAMSIRYSIATHE